MFTDVVTLVTLAIFWGSFEADFLPRVPGPRTEVRPSFVKSTPSAASYGGRDGGQILLRWGQKASEDRCARISRINENGTQTWDLLRWDWGP